MYRGKHTHQERSRSKKHSPGALVLLLMTVLLVGGVVGGTLAWLIAETDSVVNTFTYGDVNLKLEETKTDEKGNPVTDDNGDPVKTTEGNDYEMIPGEEYLKDPAVTVLAGNEACWLFVRLEENGGGTITNGDGTITTYDFDDYLTYEVASVWTQLLDEDGNAEEGVYYTRVGESVTDMSYQVLKDNKIYVLGTVTKDMLNALDNNGQDAATATYPSLSVTAYAVQYSGFEPEREDPVQVNAAAQNAWQAVGAQNTPTEP